ncbi:MAG: hypothetical protein ABIF89_01220 [bacterium]
MPTNEVREGDTVVIDGIAYVFGSSAAEAYNICAAAVAQGGAIHPYACIALQIKGKEASLSFPFTEVQTALQQ